MDLLDTSLSERCLNPRQPEVEMRDVSMDGSGHDKPEAQNSELSETAQKVQQEMSMPNSNNTSFGKLDILYRPTEYFFESSRLNNPADGFESPNVKSVEQKEIMGDENNKRTSAEMRITVSEFSGLEKVEELCKDLALHSVGKLLTPVVEDLASKTSMDSNSFHNQGEIVSTVDNPETVPPTDAAANLGHQRSEPAQTEAVNIDADVGLDRAHPVRSRKRKFKLLPSENTRVLRSRSCEKVKAPEPKAMGIEDSADQTRKTRRGRKKGMKNLPINEFSRIRTRLRYLLHRINYEQILIDAYSGEGWKGQSLEKIKPEKELQRARSQIFRCKLKIRDLFQHLDASLGQGKLPEILFDSDGQIDSEDIFCAKCGSKDLTLDNDIVLCDGGCERGFHQFCLEPPLLKEDIPPGDESWLCPGCDCKDDCFDMLNDFQGSRLSVFDNWEKVFPEEAAAAASGKNMDDICSLQSEDSEDDDYKPDNRELGHKTSGDQSCDKSDYSSASDVMVPSHGDRELWGLLSEDSEDDDFDPSALNDDQPAGDEKSSSDFTSDSEDLGAIFHEENCPDKDEGDVFSSSDYGMPNATAGDGKSSVGKVKGQSLNDELSYVHDSDAGPVFGKRRAERLDYKKLHDETYGDTASDSSDEEYRVSASSDDEHGEKAGQNRRKVVDGIAIPGSTGCTRSIKSQADAKDLIDCLEGNEHARDVEGHKTFEAQGSNSTYVEGETSSGASSGGKNAIGPGKRLGEAASQRLLESFKENQYPKQDVKESLAKELGLRVQQVTKWFENARWSFRHTYRMESKFAQISGRNGTASPQLNESTPQLESAKVSGNPFHSGVEELSPLQASPYVKECGPKDMAIGQSGTLVGEQNSSTFKSRKEKTAGNQLGIEASMVELTQNQDVPPVAWKSQDVRKSSRLQ